MLTLDSVTKTTTGAVALSRVTHANIIATTAATITLTQTDGSGDTVFTRTMAVGESDDIDWAFPWAELGVGDGFYVTITGTATAIISGQV